MRVPSGAYRPPSQSGEIERNRRKIDVLARRQDRQPKALPAAGVAPLGSVSVQPVYGLLSGSGRVRTLFPTGWTVTQLRGAPITIAQDGDASTFAPVEAGYFSITTDIHMDWDTGPGPALAHMQCGGVDVILNADLIMRAGDQTSPQGLNIYGCDLTIPWGVQWVDAHYGTFGCLYLTLKWDDAAATWPATTWPAPSTGVTRHILTRVG